MSPRDKRDRVLVTGASGYIGLHIIKQLILKDYTVRGTVRSLKNSEKVQPIRDLVPELKERLELVEADLLDEAGWNTAVEGCQYVLHVASPFVTEEPKDEQELIKPAVEGTLNVLRACAKSNGGVQRVVLTSSIAAIFAGHKLEEGNVRTFNEADWTNPESSTSDVTAYIKSKYLAEKSAWDFVAGLPEDEKFELTTMNPGFVIGPLLHKTEGASAEIIKKMMTGGMPLLPKVMMPVIDVRDVASAHVQGIELREAGGQRFILALRPPPLFKDLSDSLGKEFKGQEPSSLEAGADWIIEFVLECKE